MLVIHLILQHRSTLECFMSPLSSHCNVMAILLTIILLKITFMNDTCILPADDSILGYAVIKDHSAGSSSFHPALCLYHDCRQKFCMNCENSEPELEKGTTLIWNLQVVKPTSVHLLRMRESCEPYGNKHKRIKTIQKMAKQFCLPSLKVKVSMYECL